MRTAGTVVSAVAGIVASAVVLATVRIGWVDLLDGAVLMVSLVVLARAAIRLASDPPGASGGWS